VIITSLAVYPIKSCQGIAVDAAVVTRRGLAFDRLWMVVDERGSLLSQRNEPKLTQITTRFEGGNIVVSTAGGAELSVAQRCDGPRTGVELWRYRGEAVLHEAGSAWFSAVLGRQASLVHMPEDTQRSLDPAYGQPGDAVGFADGYPIHLTTEESLADVVARVHEPLAMGRFRPNVVVQGAESPYEEDAWHRVALGAATLRVVKRCGRCVVTTIDPGSGARGNEPLRTLAGYRSDRGSVYFGVYLAPDDVGAIVRVGDPVKVLARTR
jgi:hypothetical protein